MTFNGPYCGPLCFTPRFKIQIGRPNARKWIKRDRNIATIHALQNLSHHFPDIYDDGSTEIGELLKLLKLQSQTGLIRVTCEKGEREGDYIRNRLREMMWEIGEDVAKNNIDAESRFALNKSREA